MKGELRFRGLSLLLLKLCAFCFFIFFFNPALARNAKTNPAEVSALNAVFQHWGISAQAGKWNISGNPCTGAAVDSTTFDDGNFNPLIKCECSADNGTTCHITQLKVHGKGVTGTIPDELWNLTYLFNLCLTENALTGSLSPSVGNLTAMQYLNVAMNSLSGELPKELGMLTELLVLGLAYLHEESRLRIVHRDVKSSNILLDSDLTPKISDFGLAKLYDENKTHISTGVAGTIGYLAPEYAMRGHLTEKADVFAFGVVALELVSGRANSDQSLGQDRVYLLEWVCSLLLETMW